MAHSPIPTMWASDSDDTTVGSDKHGVRAVREKLVADAMIRRMFFGKGAK
jgi:hypothetical protein